MTRLIGLSGWSGAGKTTLIAALIPHICRRGLTVSTVKHAHHAFDIDKPGKDSYVHRESGAHEVLIASAHRFALMHELRGAPEPPLVDLLARLSPVDFVIVEGFKFDPHPKIEVHRMATDKDFIYPIDAHIRAIATDAPGPFPVPRFDLEDFEAITDWILREAIPITDIERSVPRK